MFPLSVKWPMGRWYLSGCSAMAPPIPTQTLTTCAFPGRAIKDTRGRLPVSPHHDGTKTQHGFVSLFPAPGGGFGLVWLDGSRATDPGGEKGIRQYGSRASLYNGDGKQLHEMLVSSRVCDCCSTSTAESSEGVIVAFRNRSSKEIRDIYISRLMGDHWSELHRSAMMMDGALRHARDQRARHCARGQKVAVAWFSAKDNQGHAFRSLLKRRRQDAFGPPTRVDDVVVR